MIRANLCCELLGEGAGTLILSVYMLNGCNAIHVPLMRREPLSRTWMFPYFLLSFTFNIGFLWLCDEGVQCYIKEPCVSVPYQCVLGINYFCIKLFKMQPVEQQYIQIFPLIYLVYNY
jgi:hypothetical protein